MPSRDDVRAGRVPARLINRRPPEGVHALEEKTCHVPGLKSGDTVDFGIDRWDGVLVPPGLQINEFSRNDHKDHMVFVLKMKDDEIAATLERLYP